jgi:O-antigen/teichoic acid export membrane protein
VDWAKVVGGGDGAAGKVLAVAALKLMSSDSKYSFFRHSGWMVVSTFLGGIFMAGVQIVALRGHAMEESDCNTFIALLRLLMLLGAVPSAALQTIFAQQAAAALTHENRGDLTASVRALLRAAFIFWLAVAGVVLIFVRPFSSALAVNDPMAVRVTVLAVLAVIWAPVFKGLLQGLHRFGPLGALATLEGMIRLGMFILLVKWLNGGPTGGVWAVFTGQYLVLAIAIWQTRDVWSAKISAAFSWKPWLRRAVPLTLGMGACLFMSIQVDSVFVKSTFRNSTDVQLYNCAMFIGFAMTQFIAPIAAVMFPTIVRNLALSKKTDALLLTLAVTGGFACLAATGCTLFPKLPLSILFPDKVAAAALVPCYIWALVPLALANVLIQNLLARGRFAATPWLIAVPILYVLTLLAFKPRLVAMPDDFSAFKVIIQIMGFFCLLLFGVAAWFTWRKPAKEA